jgi:hypothetical protein
VVIIVNTIAAAIIIVAIGSGDCRQRDYKNSLNDAVGKIVGGMGGGGIVAIVVVVVAAAKIIVTVVAAKIVIVVVAVMKKGGLPGAGE